MIKKIQWELKNKNNVLFLKKLGHLLFLVSPLIFILLLLTNQLPSELNSFFVALTAKQMLFPDSSIGHPFFMSLILKDLLGETPLHTQIKDRQILDDLEDEIADLEFDPTEIPFLRNLVNLFCLSFSNVFIISLLKIVCILVAVAYFTIAERKVMAAIQRRKGPNVVGFWGLLQPLADGAKLMFKELLIPTRANAIIFLIAPIMVLILSIISWSIIPSGLGIESATDGYTQLNAQMKATWWQHEIDILWNTSSTANISYGVLFLLAVSGLNVYGIIIAGWASNSKYAFLGALRSAAQMISYEVSLGILILPVILLAGSLNLTEIVAAQGRSVWFVFPLLPCAIMFFVSMLAETNRAPFDLPEAEAELVAGYNVEYSSIIFAMFFLGEYSNMLLMSTVIVLFFFGGWLAPINILNFIPENIFFSLKIVFFCYLFILVRAAFPRYRYDQLMELGWKTFLPLSLSYLIFITGVLVAFDGTPQVLEIDPQFYTETFFFAPSANETGWH